jgi:hypothetical protein
MRRTKDEVVVANGQQFLLTPLQPLVAGVALALGAVPIAARNGELTIMQSIFSPAPWHGERVRMR